MFLRAILNTLTNLLPETVSCESSASLRWFFLLLNRVRSVDFDLASETLLLLLKDVSGELRSRTDPLHALLRTRLIFLRCIPNVIT